ncbi:MAG: Yip1 family protein, partial [Pyrinomonadaceae bacterium]
PPPPMNIEPENEPAQMSEAATLGNIFIEPGNTFEDLRRKPRFILATLIICVLTFGFFFAFQQKMGDERYKRFFEEQFDKNPQAQSLTPEQRASSIKMQTTVGKYISYALPLFVLIAIALGGFIYWIAVKIVGGSMSFPQAVSLWVYSSFPVAVVSTLANVVVLFLKSADEIDIATNQRGLVHANPGFFMDGKSMPVLTTLLGTFDLFVIWGLILAAIGLQKIAKLSAASAWSIVLIMALLSLTWRTLQAYLTGNPM